MVGYEESIEINMVRLYQSLSEKDRRRYAGVEANKLGHGGTEYIASLFGCDPKTIRRGIDEVDELPVDPAKNRVRKKGGAVQMLAKRRRVLFKPLKMKSSSTQRGRQ